MSARPRHPRAAVRAFIAAALFGVLLALALATAGESPAAAGSRAPNFVVVLTDDQEAASLKVMRKTRRVLIRKGVKFRRHYASYPLCCPSRASYLTGQYAHNHGVMSNRPPEGGYAAFRDETSIAVALDRAGYRTGWVGKFLNGYPDAGRENPRDIPAGFDQWFGELTGRMFGFKVVDNGKIVQFPPTRRNYMTDVYADEGRRFIRRSAKAGKPFFLTVATLGPHGEPKRDDLPNPRPAPRHEGAFRSEPLPKPASFNEDDVSDKPSFVRHRRKLDSDKRKRLRTRYRDRLASLLAVDDLVADLVRQLRRTGELRQTYVVFTSDNGYLLGQHRLTGKTKLYEEGAKVPMVMRGPGIGRGVHKQPTANVDLAATFLDAANVGPIVPLDGVSLLGIGANPTATTGRTLLLENRNSAGVEQGRYVYLEHDTDEDGGVDEYELYDLRRDRLQLENLHTTDAPAVRPDVLAKRPELADVREELADRLDELRDCQGNGCR